MPHILLDDNFGILVFGAYLVVLPLWSLVFWSFFTLVRIWISEIWSILSVKLLYLCELKGNLKTSRWNSKLVKFVEMASTE